MGKKADKEAALAQRDFFMNNIKRLSDECDAELENWLSFEIDERISKAQKDFRSVESKTVAIVSGTEFDAEEKKAAQELFNETERLLYRVTNKLKSQLCKLNEKKEEAVENKNAVSCGNEVQQPQQLQQMRKIEAMPFDGKICEWKAFKLWLEEKVVNNADLDAEKKLMILKQSVKGTKVEGLLNVSGFDEAKNELYGTFDSTYKVTQQNFRMLKKLGTITNASSESIWNLIKAVDSCINDFKEKIPNFTDWLVTLIVIDKLDGATALAWERHVQGLSESWAQGENDRKALDYTPDWDALKDFLKSEARIHVTIDDGKSMGSDVAWNNVVKANVNANIKAYQEASTSGQSSGQSSANSYNNDIQCFLCGNNHPVSKCRQMLDASIEQRELLFKARNWCRKCIRTAHGSRPCKEAKCNNPCPKCDGSKYHNSILCPNACSPNVTYQTSNQNANRSTPLAMVTPTQKKSEGDWEDDW